MWEAFVEEVGRQIKEVADSQREKINEAAALVAKAIELEGVVHTFGSGHSALVAQEIFCRAGGIVPVNAILDPSFLLSHGALRSTNMERLAGVASMTLSGYQIRSSDVAIIISNSGKNQAPIEMALRMKDMGLKLIAVTSMKHTMAIKSGHPSGKRLFEVADVVLDTGVLPGDASVQVPRVKAMMGPTSTIIGSILLHCVIIEATHILAEKKKPPAVYVSVNMEAAKLGELIQEFMKYRGRIKHI